MRTLLTGLLLLTLIGCGPKCLEGRRIVDAPAGYRTDCGYGLVNGKWQFACGFGYFPEKAHYVCDRYEKEESEK